MFLWDQVLNSERLVSKGALEQAFTSGKTNDGTLVDYGFGWYTNVSSFLSAGEREQLRSLGADLRYVAHGEVASRCTSQVIETKIIRDCSNKGQFGLSNELETEFAAAPGSSAYSEWPKQRQAVMHRDAQSIFSGARLLGTETHSNDGHQRNGLLVLAT